MEKTIINIFFRFLKDHDLIHDFNYVMSIYKHLNKFNALSLINTTLNNPLRLIDFALPSLIFDYPSSQKSIIFKTLWCIKLLNIPYISINMPRHMYNFINRNMYEYIKTIHKDTLLDNLICDEDLIILDYI